MQKPRPVETTLYILTNDSHFYGAAVIFYPGLQEELYRYFGGSYLVLPCSVHELILMPSGGWEDSGRLREMVYEINRTVVEPEDYLSDQVYRYDPEKKGICQC